MTSTKTLLITFLFCLYFVNNITAQRHIRHKRNSSYFCFKSASIGMGLYKPYLDYWNEQSFVKDWESKFKSAPIISGNIEFVCFKFVGLRLEGQYWTNKVSNRPSTAESGISNQDLTLNLLPIIGSLTFDIAENNFFRSYIGAGGGICLVSNQFNRIYLDTNTSPIHEKVSGSGTMFVLVHGFDFILTKRLRIGIETKYTTGSYSQSTLYTGTHTVRLNGLQALAHLTYFFVDKKRGGRFAN